MNSVWNHAANNYFLDEVSSQSEKLPLGVYKLANDPKMGLYLQRVQDAFTFNYKVYGIEKDFIARCVRTYRKTDTNLGILLNGLKGTGKTVTGQMICNELGLPVIIVHKKWENVSLPSFINNIQQDVLIFFDEYEKIYNHYDDSILSVMDGVLNNGYRRVFLLTTNKMLVNEYMLQRPGRIRYINTFTDLALETIIEIIDDKLQYPEFKDDIISFVSNLEAITVDIVKAIIDEVNIHQESPANFRHIFNVMSAENLANIYEKDNDGQWKLKFPEVKVSHLKFENSHLGDMFKMNGNYHGEIRHIVSDHVCVMALEDEDDENGKSKHTTYRIEKMERKHKNFAHLLF
jgi:hypothetical protein